MVVVVPPDGAKWYYAFWYDRNKLKGATAMLSMFSGGAGSSADDDADLEQDRDRLRDFQFKMIELQVPCQITVRLAI